MMSKSPNVESFQQIWLADWPSWRGLSSEAPPWLRCCCGNWSVAELPGDHRCTWWPLQQDLYNSEETRPDFSSASSASSLKQHQIRWSWWELMGWWEGKSTEHLMYLWLSVPDLPSKTYTGWRDPPQTPSAAASLFSPGEEQKMLKWVIRYIYFLLFNIVNFFWVHVSKEITSDEHFSLSLLKTNRSVFTAVLLCKRCLLRLK